MTLLIVLLAAGCGFAASVAFYLGASSQRLLARRLTLPVCSARAPC
ncbi:MAG: hypothetical protein R3C04_07615 [Hyphomonas sp.]